MKRMKLLFSLVLPVFLCQNTQAQTPSRLIAEAHWTNNGATFTPVDSSNFIYDSPVRGGDLTHKMKYDSSTVWTADTSGYSNSWHYIQTFDGSNNIIHNISAFWNGTAWVLYGNTVYSYNTSNQMTTKIQQTWGGSSWAPVTEDVYTYLGGSLTQDAYETWSGSGFVMNSTKSYYYYTGTTQLEFEYDQDWTGSAPVYTSKYFYAYTTSGQMDSSEHFTWSGSAWVPDYLYTNTYDTSGNMITQEYQTYNAGTGSWTNVTLDLYSNFTSHNPQTEVVQMWDTTGSGSWSNMMQYTYTYNSSNQMTSSIGESWNVIGIFEYASGDPMANYYYGPYGSVTEVKNVSSSNGTANLFPVPAHSEINIDLTWNEAQASTLVVFDMTGRVAIAPLSIANGTEYHGTINVSNLADGNYIIKIAGTNGNIEKQITIAH